MPARRDTSNRPADNARDFVGYGNKDISLTWPGGTTLAVNLALNYEEGAERNGLDGDVQIEEFTEMAFPVGPERRELTLEGLYEYGSRSGVWRLIDLFDRFDANPTIFACGQALERNALVTQAFVERRYDMVGHGYRWISHFGMTEAEERDHIRRTVQSIQAATGERIIGWFIRPPQTLATRRILAEEGFLYDSAAFSDDLPYFQEVAGRPFLLMPYTQDVNDGRFWRNQFFTGRDFGDYCIDTFDVLYRESQRRGPRIMTVGLHARIIGRPGRLAGLERFLEHVKKHSGAWLGPRTEMARIWATAFAPAGTWNWPHPSPSHAGRKRSN